ncbi:MAG: hypothetical protein ACMG6S_17085 [Byssovorax sp.]
MGPRALAGAVALRWKDLVLMSPRPGSDARVYLTPLATLIGLGLCAAALYRSGGAHAGGRAVELPAPPPAQIVEARAKDRPPTSHGLRDLFRPYLQAAATRCGLEAAIAGNPEIAAAELPLSLTVAANGQVMEAAPAGRARVFGVDGAARPFELGEDRARCYAGLVRDWVRFSAAEAPSRFEAPLRMIDAQ